MHIRSFVLGLVPGLLAAGVMAVAAFGPLNPPSGSIQPTAKPLGEIEPRIAINSTNTPGDGDSIYKITQPGSYYLTQNVIGATGRHGIEIAATNVTIDLNGFAVIGAAGSLTGIITTAFSDALIIRNGRVSGWGAMGLDLNDATSGIVIGVVARDNTTSGIRTGGAFLVRDCVAEENGLSGISVGDRSVISHCLSRLNDGDGISAIHSSVTDCFAGENGDDGIVVNNGSTVARCTSFNNGGDGIQCNYGALILNNNCDINTLSGVHVIGQHNRIEGNHISQSSRGIDVDNSANFITRNSCADVTTGFSMVANNVFGAIVDRTAPGSNAVLSNSAAATTGTSDPNANICH